MPTPRHVNQVSAQGGQTSPAATASSNANRPRPGAWLEGTVASVVGNYNNNYEVDLTVEGRVPATLAIDAGVRYGDRVWVVHTGNGYIIVAQR